MPMVTPTLEKRASSTTSLRASSLSFSCSGKNAHDSRCEKPASSNGLEIGLGVGIPVFVILCVLGLFMFKNYWKEKKEAMDHDPDFDENGDATALPDFPAFAKEDPFQTRGLIHALHGVGGYPLAHLQNKSAHDLRSVLLPQTGTDEGTPIDGFVLPYQNQLGSKASLHEFARNLTDMRLYNQRRGSEYLSFTALGASGRVSPTKAAARGRDYDEKRVESRAIPLHYAELPNTLKVLLTNEDYYEGKETLDSTRTPGLSGSDDQFGVQYENELKMAINLTLPSSRRSFLLSNQLHQPVQHTLPTKLEPESGSDLESVADSEDESLGPAFVSAASYDLLSPFEDKHEVMKGAQDPVLDPANHTLNDTESLETVNFENAKIVENAPRLLQFDMLQNVSDDEAEPSKSMTPDQAEELARMKSVYKVYFDRSNLVASHKDTEGSARFEADNSQPLPSLDHLKINSELKGDTAYDKRKTTGLSIYEEGAAAEIVEGNMVHPYQQFNLHPEQQSRPPQISVKASGSNIYVSPEEPRLPADFLPLKLLPHASDIRNSTLETFTLYQPSLKVSSPSVRLQQGYFDNESSSPRLPLQDSFHTGSSPRLPHQGEVPPVIRENTQSNTVPSPAQLSRTSVVMLNPVSEITALRKFRPAGLLPSGMGSPTLGHPADDLAAGDDLIPGNRKSAVRRMMNSNF